MGGLDNTYCQCLSLTLSVNSAVCVLPTLSSPMLDLDWTKVPVVFFPRPWVSLMGREQLLCVWLWWSVFDIFASNFQVLPPSLKFWGGSIIMCGTYLCQRSGEGGGGGGRARVKAGVAKNNITLYGTDTTNTVCTGVILVFRWILKEFGLVISLLSS